MNAADLVGYTYDGAFYCLECGLPAGVDPEDDEVGHVLAGEEWDSYPVCDVCMEPCEDVALTAEGAEAEGVEA